jgi:alginate O-acetyltransferase complex protein AlgI
MSVPQIAVLAVAAILVNQLKNGRSLALLGISTWVIYWLQPHQESVNLTFWFPTMTLVLTVIFWLATSTPEVRGWRQNASAAAIILAVVILVDLNRYFKVEYFFITSTPRFQWVAAALLGFVFISFLLARAREYSPIVLILLIIVVIVALVLMKTPSVLTILYEVVADLRGKGTRTISEFSWLGFSYVAFRLLHTVIDRRTGRLQSVPLAEYVNYVIFFPAFVAGPIDRIERFVKNFEQPLPLDQNGWMEAGARLFQGLFKKFVIADALAWIALNEIFALGVKSTGWMWFVLYAYSLQIYFDFSGYTDIAIGLGRLLGVRLPENFDSPYFKPNLTQFWNSWHMTLTQWFRSYFFNPLARSLRSARAPLPVPFMIMITQVATMILIGLWHGVTLNFFLWGVWHGMGLFIQNRWSEWMRTRPFAWGTTSIGEAVLKYSNIFLTFQFVTLGWLFFALPDPAMSLKVLLRLFGVT